MEGKIISPYDLVKIAEILEHWNMSSRPIKYSDMLKKIKLDLVLSFASAFNKLLSCTVTFFCHKIIINPAD